jgi:NitT/TauT family transport system substrate-binding protein
MNKTWYCRLLYLVVSTVAAVVALCSSPAFAETHDIRIGRQTGLGYLQFHIIEDKKLIAKHAKALGLGDVTVTYRRIPSPSGLNDALLSGGIDFSVAGFPPFLTLWDRTLGGQNIRAVAGLNSQPLLLVTNNPKVKTLRDFGESDRIAVPTVKLSTQAMFLEMAAEQLFGKYDALDHLTVSMPHAEAVAALINGRAGITADFSSTPFQYQELEHPNLHTITSSYKIIGGPVTTTAFWTTKKFADDNPKVMKAVFDAVVEATAFINHNKAEAARIYKKVEHDKTDINMLIKIVNDPDQIFEVEPSNTMKMATFMHKIGRLKHQPKGWKDYFFPIMYDHSGS